MPLLLLIAARTHAKDVFPAEHWEIVAPETARLRRELLDAIAAYMGGRGCIVRDGRMAYHWGDIARPYDIASAVKPWYSFFLFKAVELGRLPSVDAPAADYAPCLRELNADLDHKDRRITFRHFANQTSCYGVRETPGTAFDYNDWQIALFFDTLFLKVYASAYERLDEEILRRYLADPIQCEDKPSFLAFKDHRPGRLAISPRDFCRFGLLFLHEGRWKRQRLLDAAHIRTLTRSPLPPDLPRTRGEAAEMCEGQRSLGSESIPDNQTDHKGSYSWLWWTNGTDAEGNRLWPDAPEDTYAALGHANGMRGMAVIPSLGIVLSWNDTALGDRPAEPNPLNAVFALLCRAALPSP